MEVLDAVDEPRLRRLLDDRRYFWLDLPDGQLDAAGQLLGLHPAAMEDTREWDQLPKLDVYDDHLLLVFFSARVVGGVAEPVEVHVYVSGNWIVTVRRCPTPLDDLRERMVRSDFADEDEIVYLVLDAIMDGWDPVIDQVDGWVDELEGFVLDRPRQHQLGEIYFRKQQVNDLVRHIAPQQGRFPAAVEAVHALPGITRGSREWLRDVTAHLDIVASDLRRILSDLNDLTQLFFNANANRLNRTATRVTVAGVFFLLWTLVTGFFGQNFDYLVSSVDSRTDFLVFGVGGLVVPSVILGVVLWRRRRDWW
jgi:magnesium transporter